MNDIDLVHDDHVWLRSLTSKLEDNSKTSVREVRALEYFYRSWFLSESDRYPALYMALESIFGDANRATQAIIDSVRQLLGTHIPEPRIRALSDLRAAVIHGGAPEVFDSSKYAKYYRVYREDPVRDLGLIAAECLRKRIFGTSMNEKADPSAELIRKAVVSGRMPALKESSILDETDDNAEQPSKKV